ncbi:siderophore-interacting protein [Nakamurella sp.]|uniref:siderophore-interacting protein n=1 Tax=Nakamurella sp. TaxID=1869182 RepID=UPI003B3ADAE6
MINRIHRIIVTSARRLTPGLLRVEFTGDLGDFESSGIGDEYVRLFLPGPGQSAPTMPIATDDGYWAFPEGAEPSPVRCYTIRAWDAENKQLTIDFVVHDGGVAAAWALRAQPGDVLASNTPRGLYEPAADITWRLLVADATGLPAAARLLEQAPPGVRTRAVLEVASPADRQPIDVPTDAEVRWVYGGNGHGPSRLDEIVRSAELPTGQGYVWVAGEAGAARSVRKYLRRELGLPGTAYKVVGYWTEDAEAWREKYEALPEETRSALAAMWDDATRDEEEIEDEYQDALERLGL